MPYRNPFERLGLDADAGADAKSIRRAYARELKLIDQELDPAGFQALREAYEAALTWTAPHEPPIPGTHSIPAAPTTMQGADTAEQVALAAMRDFRTAAAQLAAGQASRPSQWERMHRALLDDERLFNLQARDLFEAHIARLLVSGWQPGHEMIFAVSSQVFQWESDPLRLHQLGNAGAVLDQALDEQVRLHSLGDTDVHWAYAILDALRKNTPVTDHQLRNDMAQLDRMVTCLPTWMDIMVDPDAVRRWEARFCTLPPVKKLPWMHWDLRPLGYFLLAAMAVYLLFFQEWHLTGSKGIFPTLESAAPAVQLPPELMQQLDTRMAEFPTPVLPPGVHRADFTVLLDAQGHVLSTIMLRTSDSAGYDDVAVKAIRAIAPYPREVPREFTVSFTIGPRP